MLTRWLRQWPGSENFSVTSITINRNLSPEVRRNVGNAGDSVIKTVGDFVGGDLYWWPLDEGGPLENLDNDQAVRMDTSNFARFNGNCAHGNMDFAGLRFSVIWFTTRLAGLRSSARAMREIRNLQDE